MSPVFPVAVVVTVLSAWWAGAGVDALLWACSYKPCGPDDLHTVCKYPWGVNRLSPHCMGYGAATREMTTDMRECALHWHNVYRQNVALGNTEPKQPPAANMMKLKYSREAELIVQHWMNACEDFGHDTCRHLEDGTWLGQNIFQASDGYASGNVSAVEETVCHGQVELYYNEIKFLVGRTPDEVERFKFDHQTGHYTALVWATATAVGCAWVEMASYYSTPQHMARPIRAGCNYVGYTNLIGAPNYLVGDSCSQCPDGARCSDRYPGLCTFDTEEEEYISSAADLPGYFLVAECGLATAVLLLALL